MYFQQMMKRLMELKKEKEDLALEVEREEELLTNTLQKKLNQVCVCARARARVHPEVRYRWARQSTP